MFGAFKRFKEKAKLAKDIRELKKNSLIQEEKFTAAKHTFTYYSNDKLEQEVSELRAKQPLDIMVLMAAEEILIERGVIDHSIAHEALNEMRKQIEGNKYEDSLSQVSFLGDGREKVVEEKEEYDPNDEFFDLLSEFVETEPEDGIKRYDIESGVFFFFKDLFSEVDNVSFDLAFDIYNGRLIFELKPYFSYTNSIESNDIGLNSLEIHELNVIFCLKMEEVLKGQRLKKQVEEMSVGFGLTNLTISVEVYGIEKKGNHYLSSMYAEPFQVYLLELYDSDLPF